MADMVKVPGIGPVKKPWLYAGVALTVGIIGYAYWQRSRAAATDTGAATTAGAASSDYTEGSDASGYNTVAPSAYSDQYAPYGYDIYGNPLPPPTGLGSNGAYQTNADWATAAESALQSAGVTLEVSGAAISRVLGGLTVTSTQRDLFMQAVGLLGQPPQGYPTPIKLVDTPGQPAPPGKPATLAAPKNLKATGIFTSHVDIDWDPVPGASGYQVYVNGASKTSSAYTKEHVWGLHPGTTYKIGVRAIIVDPTGPGSADIAGPFTTITVRTKK